MLAGRKNALVQLAILLVRIYQIFLAPWFASACRFSPTCSQYAIQALQTHTLLFAIKLILGRLTRCHPMGGHGYDPVPVGGCSYESK